MSWYDGKEGESEEEQRDGSNTDLLWSIPIIFGLLGAPTSTKKSRSMSYVEELGRKLINKEITLEEYLEALSKKDN